MNRKPFLRQSLDLRLSQRLALTPSLLQKIELLQLNKLELQEMLNQELIENPILEEIPEPEIPRELLRANAGISDEVSTRETPPSKERDSFEEIDFRYFFDEYLDTGYRSHEAEDADRPGFETFLSQTPSLEEHLNWQLGLLDVRPEIARVAAEIIGNLDEDGYFGLSLDELREVCDCDVKDAEEALRIVQEMDPIGVGARDLRECLLLQLANLEMKYSLAWKIIEEHSGLLEGRKFKEIASVTGASFEEVLRAVENIKGLIPKPGQKYGNPETNYVQPEVVITKVNNEFVIMLNDEGMPQLRLNTGYKDMLKNREIGGETRDFLKEKFRSAVDLLRSVSQRKQTIYKVCVCITDRQKEFLEKGPAYLKPMLIKDVAGELGMHSSTISRVVTNKYVDTPQGVMELRKFFTMGVESASGVDMSIVQIKLKIRKMIEEEDKKKPYSDNQLGQMLRRDNIFITRRTVAKYREQMQIAGSHERKSGYLV